MMMGMINVLLKLASKWIAQYGQGRNITLHIPAGTYYVGRQIPNLGFYYFRRT